MIDENIDETLDTSVGNGTENNALVDAKVDVNTDAKNIINAFAKNVTLPKNDDIANLTRRFDQLQKQFEIERISKGDADLRYILNKIDPKTPQEDQHKIAEDFFSQKKAQDTRNLENQKILSDPRIKELSESEEYKDIEPKALLKIRQLLDNKLSGNFENSGFLDTSVSQSEKFKDIIKDKKLSNVEMLQKLKEAGAPI